MQFDPTGEQKAILAHSPKAHARILAGPGTGKSTILVALLNQLLLDNNGLRVRMLTFTRAATAELTSKLTTGAGFVPSPSTVHSFAISILLRNAGSGGFPEPLRIVDTWEYKNIVRDTFARRANVSARTIDVLFWEMAANFESLSAEKNPKIDDAERNRFLSAWYEHRRVFGYTLLSELPFALRRALKNHDDLRGLDVDILLVDEYQDLNACDLEVIRLVAERGPSTVIGCGDDDQSIYSWRKAAPEGIRRFLSDYNGASDYSLSVSIRCGTRVIQWANHVISGDPERPADRSTLDPALESKNGEVALLRFNDNRAEANGIAKLVHGLITKEGLEANEILILMRTDHNGTFSTPIRKELRALCIGSSEENATGRTLEEGNNRRALEMIRILVDGQDSIAWASILRLTEGVGSTFFDYVYQLAKESGSSFSKALMQAYECGFPDAPRSASKAGAEVSRILRWLEETETPEEEPDCGWGQWIIDRSQDDVWPDVTSALVDLMVRLDEHNEGKQPLASYLASMEPVGKDMALAKSAGARIMTMGGSKGLTVRATVVAGVEEELLSRPDADLSEERRILYVAMTRAKEYVFCTWARRRRGPTARAGVGGTGWRSLSHFLEGGPVESEDGRSFVNRRFDQSAD